MKAHRCSWRLNDVFRLWSRLAALTQSLGSLGTLDEDGSAGGGKRKCPCGSSGQGCPTLRLG